MLSRRHDDGAVRAGLRELAASRRRFAYRGWTEAARKLAEIDAAIAPMGAAYEKRQRETSDKSRSSSPVASTGVAKYKNYKRDVALGLALSMAAFAFVISFRSGVADMLTETSGMAHRRNAASD